MKFEKFAEMSEYEILEEVTENVNAWAFDEVITALDHVRDSMLSPLEEAVTEFDELINEFDEDELTDEEREILDNIVKVYEALEGYRDELEEIITDIEYRADDGGYIF